MTTHKGTCFCGAVEIELQGEPVDMGYCHCGSCRSFSGAPLVAFAIWPAERLAVTRGADLLAGFNKVGTSDRKHCVRCGGHLYLDHPQMGVVDVRAAVLRTLAFSPRLHLFYEERVLPVRDGLPKFKDMPQEIGGSGDLLPE